MTAVRLFRREFGKENTQKMIILHGLFGMSDNWVGIAKFFSSKYHVIIPDHRNHGLSPHTDEFGYEEMTEDLLLLMDEENISSAVLLGHSMGGKLAMNFAFEYPQRVDALIIADMSMKQGEFRANHAAILKTIADTDLKLYKSFSALQQHLESQISEKRIVHFVMKNVLREPQGRFKWKLNFLPVYDNIHKVMEEVVPGEPFNKPVLVIRGDKSDYVSDDDFKEMKEVFPLAAMETMEKASHWLHADDTQTFIKIVDDFLSKLPY